MWINQDVIRHGWRIRSQFPANRNQRTKRVRTRLLICGLNRKTRLICGWIRRRPRRLDDSLTRAILLSFVLAIGPSRRAAASAGARKLLSSYSRFGRVNGIGPLKGGNPITQYRGTQRKWSRSLMTETVSEKMNEEPY